MEGPWTLWFYDPEGNDCRGEHREMGNYRSFDRAHTLAAEYNAEILRKINKKRKDSLEQRYQTSLRTVKEHNVLVSAGLRPGPYKSEPVLETFEPQTALVPGRNEHFYVSEIDFEDSLDSDETQV
jgi:uncharacterized protein involved in type VI secretion and phage assembly